MNKIDWLQYPDSIPAKSSGASIQTLLNSSYANLAIVAGLAGLAILLEDMLDGFAKIIGNLPAVGFVLMIALVAWIFSRQSLSESIQVQRIILVIMTWGIAGVILFARYSTANESVSPIFLLTLIAMAALTTRPLLDQLLGLVIPTIVAIFLSFQIESYGIAGRSTLVIGLACLIAFIIAWQRFRQRIHILETMQIATNQRRQLDELTQRDPVTELYNDTAFKTRLTIELARSIRHKRSVCLIAFELYENGHPLRSVGRTHFETTVANLAAILNKKLRTTDILGCDKDGRFLVAVPDTDLTRAQIAANRIQITIENYNTDNNTALSFSCGITEYHGETIEALILVTEARLRESFNRGPDQIVVE